jgi:hypothetical protein
LIVEFIDDGLIVIIFVPVDEEEEIRAYFGPNISKQIETNKQINK